MRTFVLCAFAVLALIFISGCTSKKVEVQQEVSERGGTLQEWKDTLLKNTGPDSEESKVAAECQRLMDKKIAECSQHEGWSVDNAMEITNFKTDKHYEFQDIRKQDCPDTSAADKQTRHVDTAFLDAQTDSTKASSYQVVCSINCQWWDCQEEELNLTGVWVGSRTEISTSEHCTLKDTGPNTFRITMTDKTSFSGTLEYDMVSTVLKGEHCAGDTYTGKATVSGTISENKISGTMSFTSATFPFTATIEGDSLSGTYSYTTTYFGAPLSATGEIVIKKG